MEAEEKSRVNDSKGGGSMFWPSNQKKRKPKNSANLATENKDYYDDIFDSIVKKSTQRIIPNLT